MFLLSLFMCVMLFYHGFGVVCKTRENEINKYLFNKHEGKNP